jgi:hypothetical protein
MTGSRQDYVGDGKSALHINVAYCLEEAEE